MASSSTKMNPSNNPLGQAIPPLPEIQPLEGEPSYPPYNIQHVTSYTDDQILYYIQTNQITDRPAFLRAKQEQDEFLRAVSIRNSQVQPLTTTPTSTQPPEWTLDNNSEPDTQFPQPI